MTDQPELINSAGMAAGTRFTDEVLRMFRALGDETRLRLLQRLRGGEQCVCDLTEDLDSRQSLRRFTCAP